MANYLVLTAEQAEAVRATPICPGQVFAPIMLKDGTYFIGDHPSISEAIRNVCAKSTKGEFSAKIQSKLVDQPLATEALNQEDEG